MTKKKPTDDLEKELVESGNWTRIDEIIKEVKQLYNRERNARAHRTNLLLGQRFLELRKLVTGTNDDLNPKSAEARLWGKFVKSHLKGCGVSRATTYRCAQAWKAASAIVPEPVLTHIAEREEMIGVAVSGEKPLGKFTLAMEAAMDTEPDFGSEEGVEAFIETVVGNPEKSMKSDPMQLLYRRTIKGLVAIAKARLTKTTMDGERREVAAEMLSEPLYTLVSTVQRGIEMSGTHEYETANDLPASYGDWHEVIAKKTEPVETKHAKEAPKAKTKREANSKPKSKPKPKRKAKSKAKPQEPPEDITGTTPHGYYAKRNRKPKNATQEAQPWEIYKNNNGAKSQFCCRESSRQDAEAQTWKLDRIAEEEKRNTTTINTTAAGASAM